MKRMCLILVLVGGCAVMPPVDSGDSSSGQLPPIQDQDSDGIADHLDNCPQVANANQLDQDLNGQGDACEPVPIQDQDADGVPDDLDNCPHDPSKTEPGICGCAVAETDTDNDGMPDCLDQCPNDTEKIEPGMCGCERVEIILDTDSDGIFDCVDGCPMDPQKATPGVCGCGVDDFDFDLDGFADLCMDNCPFTFNPDQRDSDLDTLGDACDSSPFPFVSGDVFSFLTPDETELFLLLVDTLNADIDRFVDNELSLEMMDLGNRGLLGSTLVCSAECRAEQLRISLKRDGTALSAIDATASFGISLALGLAETIEINTFNCQNYPNRSFTCTNERGLPPVTCDIGGLLCD